MPSTIHELTEATSFTPGTTSELVMAVTTDAWTTERARRINTANFATSILNQAIVINEGGADVDFRVEASGQANALFVEGSSGNLGFGTAAPAAKLDVNVAAAAAVPGIVIDQDDTSQISLQIDSEAATVDVIDIPSPATTTASVIDINADALTTGKILDLTSDSADSSTRQLVNIVNDNTAATGAALLRLQQDSTGDILQIFDGASQVLTIDDEGNISGTGAIAMKGVAYISATAGADFDTKLDAAITAVTAGGVSGYVVVDNASYTYDGSSPVTVPETVTLVNLNGQIDMTSATGNLIINGPIVSPSTDTPFFKLPTPTNWTTGCKLKIRQATGTGPWSKDLTTQCNKFLPVVPAMWFDDNDTDDIGLRIQKAVAACGEGCHIIVHPGSYYLRTSVVLDKDSWPQWVHISGCGHIMSTMVIPASQAIIGFNLYNAEECQIDHLRILEDSGTQVSCCILVTGSTNKVHNCWFGNAKYGFATNRSAGTSLQDTVIEGAIYGLWIHPGGTDGTITGFPSGSTVVDFRAQNVEVYGCSTANLYINATAYKTRAVVFTGCTFKEATAAGRNFVIDGNADHQQMLSFVNCCIYGGLNVGSPYCGGTINDSQVTFVGGQIFDNPGYDAYNNADPSIDGEDTCGVYITGDSLVQFFGVTRGNYQASYDSQHMLFKRGDADCEVVDYAGIDQDHFLPITYANLMDTTHRINSADRWPGKEVWDNTNSRPVWSSGYSKNDDWVDADGVSVGTPVSATPSHTPSHTVSHTPSATT